MPLIASIDGPNRRILLSSETVGTSINPIDIYKEMRALRVSSESLRNFDVFLSASGNVSKGGGTFTARLVTCLGGTRIIPFDTTHELTIIGEIITDDGQSGVACFDRSSLSAATTVDINYQPPQVEVIQVDTSGTNATITNQNTIISELAVVRKLLGNDAYFNESTEELEIRDDDGSSEFRTYLLANRGRVRVIFPPILNTPILTINDTILLTWSDKSATSYNVYRSTDNQNFSLVANRTTTSYEDSDVAELTTYYYRVNTIISGRESENSNTVTITTQEFEFDPTRIQNLVAWFKVENIASNLWNTPGHQLNNEVSGGVDGQLFTCRGIEFLAANDDEVSIPRGELNNDFTILVNVQAAEVGKSGINILTNGNEESNFGWFFYTSSRDLQVRLGEFQNDFQYDFDVNHTPGQWYQLALVREGTDLSLYVDGQLFETKTNVSTLPFNYAGIGRAEANDTRDQKQGATIIYYFALSAPRILQYYNNRNKLIAFAIEDRVSENDRCYPFTEGTYTNGGIVLEYLNNEHGTFITSAVGAYDASVNDLESGLQLATHGWSEYDPLNTGTDILVLSNTPTSTTDLFGNTVQNTWKVGRLNFPNEHGGFRLSGALGVVRTFPFAIKLSDVSGTTTIFNLGTPGQIQVVNGAIVASMFTSIVVDGAGNLITNNTWHYIELQNTEDVAIDQTGDYIPNDTNIEVIPFTPYSTIITSQESAQLRQYFNQLTQ